MSTRSVRRKLWINLALVAAAGLLVIVALLEPGMEPPEPLPPLTDMDRDAVERIVIHSTDGDDIELQKTDRGWQLTAPRALPANSGKLENLLAITGAESRRRYPAGEMDLAAAQLDGDSHSLTLNDTTFSFGGTDPINGWRYIRVGDTVHLVRDSVFHLMRQGPLYWADNRLLPGDAGIAAIELPERRIFRDDNGLWQAEPPLENAGADALVGLVQRWESARALSVKPLAEPPGADAPPIMVHLEGGGSPIEFRLIESDDAVFLARADLALRYAITETLRDDLLQPDAEPPAEPAPDEAEAAEEPDGG